MQQLHVSVQVEIDSAYEFARACCRGRGELGLIEFASHEAVDFVAGPFLSMSWNLWLSHWLNRPPRLVFLAEDMLPFRTFEDADKDQGRQACRKGFHVIKRR